MVKWAMLFPGQGSQYAGMGRELRDEAETARHVFEEADETLGYKLSDIMMGKDSERLTRTEFAQPALLTVSVAAYRVFMERIGGTPDYMAGHSLGEWSALTCAEAMSFADALRLVALRGRLMQEAADAGEGAMCAIIGLNAGEVEAICLNLCAAGTEVVVSNYNSPVQTVISGRKDAVQRAVAEFESRGAKAVYLNVSAAFHSPLMASAAERLEESMRGAKLAAPRFPVISNVTALPHASAGEIARSLVEQIVSPVRWEATMRFLAGANVSTAVELGPQAVLARLVKANTDGMQAYSFEKPSQTEELHEQLKLVRLGARQQTLMFVASCLTTAAATRNRNWDERAYREGVMEPYRNIEAIQERLDAEDRAPEPDEMQEAFRNLVQIFQTKGVQTDEAEERLLEIIIRTGTGELFPEYTDKASGSERAVAAARG
ncbi:malonyl CoA-acyl carrier protein transacylase [Paenibacillus curdlanolyticus YK9]|uniref:[acyl-carrier-protein] S-malonyltransferase n=1 Tax=Paenibacillus curdlanolyticus YK9 TaxID=717606 RepID=E0IGA2_9BACL|nr:ACP S-malonyltransferase [Paenibacillus curdlanolyticus]EFM08504.1 malonyl CoA-acyl carrier protein transacylase [Paenibacillus curdlanolyticus YK9]